MFYKLRDAIIASVRLRRSQGDCPIEPAHSVEMLEEVIIDLAGPPSVSPDPAGEEADLRAVMNSATPTIGEGDYAYAKLDQLPKMLRDQCRDVLFCEAEPHVIADAWNIVRMAADELEAALASSPIPKTFPREAERERGQAEGFAAAVTWLRERSAIKPPATLHHAAMILADQLEQSRVPASAALLQEDRQS